MPEQIQLPKVSVVILNYNTSDLLHRFLPFVLQSTYSNLEVVVADNASTDGSVDMVEEKYPDVKVIRLEKNLGFAEGYNEALNQLDSNFWLLLNSDVEVDADWLQPMVDLMLDNDEIAAVQPKIRDYKNRQLFEYAGGSGGFLDRWGYPFCRGRMFDSLELDAGQYDDARSVFWATGAAMLVRADDYKKVGGMDGDFFAHMEEIDMCWRFQNIGQQVWVCPQAIVYHMGGGTLATLSSTKTFLNFRNNLALLTKNLPAAKVPGMLAMRLILDSAAGIKFILDFRLTHCLAIIRAHWSFYFRFGMWWSKRTLITVRKKPEHLSGWINKSIVWHFFVKGRKTFKEFTKS